MVENIEKESNTMGFSVSGAPLWLCRELSKEARQYYANVYWPVIVDWYRKAKEFENITRGGLPAPGTNDIPELPANDTPKVKLFGKNTAVERR